MCLGMGFSRFALLESVVCVFCQIWEICSHYFFEYFFQPYPLFLVFWDSNDTNVRIFLIVPSIPEALFRVFPTSFSLCCSEWLIYVAPSSGLLILSSVPSDLQFSPFIGHILVLVLNFLFMFSVSLLFLSFFFCFFESFYFTCLICVYACWLDHFSCWLL